MHQILLVENQPIIAKSMEYIISSLRLDGYNLDTVGTFQEMEKAVKVVGYDTIIFSLKIAKQAELDHLLEMVKRTPDSKVFLFVENAMKLPLRKVFFSGIMGVLDKQATEAEIREALFTVAVNKKRYANTNLIIDLLLKKNEPQIQQFNKLAKREREVARLLVKGENNMQICKQLKLKPSTISTFKTRIFKKLNIKNLIELEKIGRKPESNVDVCKVLI